MTGRHLFGKASLTERLITNAPNMDVHIIPDQTPDRNKMVRKRKNRATFSASDILKSIFILSAASCLGYLFQQLGFDEANIITIYVLCGTGNFHCNRKPGIQPDHLNCQCACV